MSTSKKETETELTFPTAVYKGADSKLVQSQDEADAAEGEGWSHKPPSAEQLPADRPEGPGHPGSPDRPEHPDRPGGGRPHPDNDLPGRATPKKKD